MAKKATAKQEAPEPIDLIAELEREVSGLERLRKSDPGSFYYAAGRANSPAQIGPNRALVDELQGRLKGFVGRLEKLR